MATLVKPTNYGPSSSADPAEGRRFGGAFWVSVFLHGTAVALLIYFTLLVRDQEEERNNVFEVVAGPGDNFMAEQAPAGGEAPAAVLRMPALESVPTWTPPAPAPEPVPVPVAPVTPAPPVVEPTPVPNFAQDMKATLRQEQRATQREIRQQRATEAAAAAAAAKAEAARQKATSFADFQRQQNVKPAPRTSTPPKADPGKRIDTTSIRPGVAGATGAQAEGAGGKALTAAQAASMERYYGMLVQRLRDSHEKPGGLSDLLNAEVQFTLAATGVITGVRIVRSSGNAEFDRSVLDAFVRVRMPTRPDGKTDVQRLVFRMTEA